jgi:cytochrome c556
MAIRFTTVAACLAVVVSTAWNSSQAQQVPASYMHILMLNMVGPPENSLRETVGKRNLSDQDWERMKQVVARLTESATLVSTGGNSSEEAERAKSAEWKNWAGKFTDTVSIAARAVEHKDRMALVAASNAMVEACKGCHVAFPRGAAH